jgi:hypothetical protein
MRNLILFGFIFLLLSRAACAQSKCEEVFNPAPQVVSESTIKKVDRMASELIEFQILAHASSSAFIEKGVADLEDRSFQIVALTHQSSGFNYKSLLAVLRIQKLAEQYLQVVRQVNQRHPTAKLSTAIQNFSDVVALEQNDFIVMSDTYFSNLSTDKKKHLMKQLSGDLTELESAAEKINKDYLLVSTIGSNFLWKKQATGRMDAAAHSIGLYDSIASYYNVLLAISTLASKAQLMTQNLQTRIGSAITKISSADLALQKLAPQPLSYDKARVRLWSQLSSAD